MIDLTICDDPLPPPKQRRRSKKEKAIKTENHETEQNSLPEPTSSHVNNSESSEIKYPMTAESGNRDQPTVQTRRKRRKELAEYNTDTAVLSNGEAECGHGHQSTRRQPPGRRKRQRLFNTDVTTSEDSEVEPSRERQPSRRKALDRKSKTKKPITDLATDEDSGATSSHGDQSTRHPVPRRRSKRKEQNAVKTADTYDDSEVISDRGGRPARHRASGDRKGRKKEPKETNATRMPICEDPEVEFGHRSQRTNRSMECSEVLMSCNKYATTSEDSEVELNHRSRLQATAAKKEDRKEPKAGKSHVLEDSMGHTAPTKREKRKQPKAEYKVQVSELGGEEDGGEQMERELSQSDLRYLKQ